VTDDDGAESTDSVGIEVLVSEEWHISVVDTYYAGRHCSLAVVNGSPAISYRGDGVLKYVRASDTVGGSWGSPVTVDSTGCIWNSLAIVNGNPAISYNTDYNSELKYVRATDTSGSSWGIPVTADAEAAGGGYNSLAVVNGNPAISYQDYTNKDLKYVRATDASGISWGTPLILDSEGINVASTSLTVVNDNPAISYGGVTTVGGHARLKYLRASDANGNSWGTPLIVDSEGNMTAPGTSLVVVNGNPAISYSTRPEGGDDDLRYVRANDASGSSWGAPLFVDTVGYTGWASSLAIVDGNPAIACCARAIGDLRYVRAVDASGESWGGPETVDSEESVGLSASLIVVNDHPAISYWDETNRDLKFAIYY
jgi:hypothetical protein